MTATEVKKCEDLLFADPRLKYFFEISLPAALARDRVIGHVLLVCADRETTDCFLSLLNERTPSAEMTYYTDQTASAKVGDLGALVTNLKPGDKLAFINKSLNFNSDCVDFLKHALDDYTVRIPVGKGPSSCNITLDLPRFTCVVCVEKGSRALSELMPCFQYVIKIDEENLPRICITKIKDTARGTIDDNACEYIAHKAKYDIKTAMKYLTRVFEYQQFSTRSETITKELVEEIFDLARIGITIEEPIEDDEIYSLFREIRDSLSSIQEDIHAMRGHMADFIQANGGEW